MRNSRPLVSVVIPVHNGEATICRAIDSVLQQTYQDREIVLIDDGSTDLTVSLLRDYEQRIHLVELKHCSRSTARNKGIELARGDYIAFLDDDDAWFPEKLERQTEILAKHPSVGLTFSNLDVVSSENGEKLESTYLPAIWRHSPSWEELLVGRAAIATSSVLVRRDLIIAAGSFDEKVFTHPGYEDTDMWLRLRELADFHYLDVCLGEYCYNQEHFLLYDTSLLRFARKYWTHPKLQHKTESYPFYTAISNLPDEFVKMCAETMTVKMMSLIKREGNKVSREMLDTVNEMHKSMENVFGDTYQRITGLGSMKLNKLDLTLPPTALLLYFYLLRPDLQELFPEVRSGRLGNLIRWAAAVSKGTCRDAWYSLLLPHRDQLQQLNKYSWGSIFGAAWWWGAAGRTYVKRRYGIPI